MIPCEPNQSLSILKFRFLFHGFQGKASQVKLTIVTRFFVFLPPPTVPSASILIVCVRGSRAILFPVAAPGLL